MRTAILTLTMTLVMSLGIATCKSAGNGSSHAKSGVAEGIEEKVASLIREVKGDLFQPYESSDIPYVQQPDAAQITPPSTPLRQLALGPIEKTLNYDPLWRVIETRKSLHPELADVPTDQLVALALYSTEVRQPDGLSYVQINSALRKKDTAELARLAPVIDGMLTSLAKMPAHKGLVYRGAYIRDPTVIEKYVDRAVVEEAAFASSSVNLHVALTFAMNSRNGSDVSGERMLFVTESAKGVDISIAGMDSSIDFFSVLDGGAVPAYGSEREVLFPPGTRFEVERVELLEDEELRLVFLKELRE
jgi:hypothetical protein